MVHDKVPHARFDGDGIRHLGFRGVGRYALVTGAQADMLDEDVVDAAADVEAVVPDGDARPRCGGPGDGEVAVAVSDGDAALKRDRAGDLEYDGPCPFLSLNSLAKRARPGVIEIGDQVDFRARSEVRLVLYREEGRDPPWR